MLHRAKRRFLRNEPISPTCTVTAKATAFALCPCPKLGI